jgi:hypothetical protein
MLRGALIQDFLSLELGCLTSSLGKGYFEKTKQNKTPSINSCLPHKVPMCKQAGC